MIQMALVTLAVLAFSLVIAGLLIRNSKVALGILLGLLPIVVMEAVMHWSLDTSIAACIDRACAAAGLDPGCQIAEFGCTEWSGIGRFMFWAAGFADAVLYAIGVGLIVVLRSRRRSNASAVSPPSGDGPAAA